MPALAVIAQPASAHRQTTQRCDYDPISGQSFNCRQVPVSHTHPKPKPEPTCPAGTTGTPPNCSPIPSDNTNQDADQGDDSDGSDGSDESDDSDSSDSDTEDSGSEEQQDEEGDGGTDPQVPNHYSPPPDTSPRPTPPPTTAPPVPNHYSPPPDTSPRPEPEDDESDSDDGEAEEAAEDDDCLSGTFVSGNCEPKPEGSPSGSEAEPAADDEETAEADDDDNCSTSGEHRHMLAGHMTGCHDATPADHCSDGEHAHTHAGSCHRNKTWAYGSTPARRARLGTLTLTRLDGGSPASLSIAP